MRRGLRTNNCWVFVWKVNLWSCSCSHSHVSRPRLSVVIHNVLLRRDRHTPTVVLLFWADVQAGSVQPHSLASRLLLYLLYRSQWPTRGKGKGLDTCYSATYTSQTRDQQRFTISEVTTDWHELLVPQRIMWPSIARANGQLDPQCS